jgi:predicted DNA-binding transcriptional regulator AlpA
MKNDLNSYGLPVKLRAKDIKKHFSVSLSTIWHYVRQNKLNAKKISPRITVFDRDEVLELFNGK